MTDTADRFTSKYRQRPAGSGTRDRRRVFETNDDSKSSVTAPGTTGRYRSTGDRGDRTDRTEKTESVTSRISRLNTNDDKEDEVDNTTTNSTEKHEDEEEQEQTTRKSHKKAAGGASANSARKRRDRKNLREKRRSTGVVIMPGQPGAAPADEDEKQLQENTAMNTEATSGKASDSTDNEDLTKKIEAYETAIEEWKDELAKAKKEIEALQRDNQRLKDENSALLRVVGSLSGPRK